MNEDILGGLKIALERGDSLEKAMLSFYNSGYKKEEIENAARALLQYQSNPAEIQQQNRNQGKPIQPSQQIRNQQTKSQQSNQQDYYQKQMPAKQNPVLQKQPLKQIVSGYENKKDPRKILIIIIVSLLVFLVASLISIYIFRDAIIGFFSSLFQ
ncbi:MAG: hypothetical protein ABIH49_00175 [archaeon]